MIPRISQTSPVQARYLAFLEALKNTGFEGDISPDYANRTVMATDNSIYQVLPQGVVYPRNQRDLERLAELSNQPQFHDIVLSPRGGGTGTNGQSLTDGLLVDVSRHMNKILEINAEEGWARVQAGVVKDQLNAALKPHGLFFAPELSTSNRATIGGMINTDASGQGSVLYGKTRDHVLELTTVLLDGNVLMSMPLSEEDLDAQCERQDRVGLIHRLLNSMEKEHGSLIQEKFPKLNRCLTGYDLAHIRDDEGRFNLNNILCGSEGSLGFISEAKLNVLSIPKEVALVVVTYSNFDSALRDADRLMQAGPTSIETVDDKVLNLAKGDIVWHDVAEFFDDDPNSPVEGVNLVEYTAADEESLRQGVDRLVTTLTEGGNANCLGHEVAWGAGAVGRIWGMRKKAVGLLGNAQGEARPVPFVEDTAVPPEHLADFIAEFRQLLDSYNLRYGMFGHVDAGVLHVRPALDMKDPEQEAMVRTISDRVAELCHKYHGLLWGEHGKGVRSEYAPKFFGELYPQLQRVKAAFDPRNQLNPGKIATPDDQSALLKIDEVPTHAAKSIARSPSKSGRAIARRFTATAMAPVSTGTTAMPCARPTR
jgi:FAD/FMN-containing dehydrogenase